MMSVAPGEIVLRGESANRYIGMDNNGNLIAYVSKQLAPVAYPADKSLSLSIRETNSAVHWTDWIEICPLKSQIETKEMVTDSIDAIALVGHVVSEISSIRREQLRPSLKPEFQTSTFPTTQPCSLLGIIVN